MGLCVINIVSFFYIDKQIENIDKIECFAKIISIKEEKEYTDKYIIRVLKNKENHNIENINLIIYTEKKIEYSPGDIVKIEGEFSKPDVRRNYGGFDYSKYLKQFKIFGIISVEKIEKVTENIYIKEYFEIFRKDLLDKISNYYTKENAGFLKSLLFGKTDELSEEIKINFKDSNISHVLAISGMHVSYIIIAVRTFINIIIKNKKLKNYILIFCLIVFSMLTGNPVSGIRACIMGIMICLASNYERKNNIYFSLVYSLIIIIVYNPYNVYNIGLWLSYMGTLGIIMFYKFFKIYIYHITKKINFKTHFYKISIIRKIIFFIEKNILENFFVTISAQILIFPIIMYFFNTISFSFFVSNILISFFIGPILILGYFSVILAYIEFPFLTFIVYIEEILIQIILNISKVCAKLPFSKINVVTPNFIFIFLFYLLIFIFRYIFYNKKIYVLKLLCSHTFVIKELKKNITNKLKIINYRKCISYLINKKIYFYKQFLFILVIILVFCNIKYNKQFLEINFIDVGQGDCTYIKTPNGKNIIIDGGEGMSEKYDYGENVVVPYLLDRKVEKIDYLIVSHADSDHIGGLFSVLENIKVRKIILGIQPENSRLYEELINISNKKKIEIVHVYSNTKVQIEENIEIKILWPDKKKLVEENALNNNSLVFKFLYNDFSILFTGDIEKVAEEILVDLYQNTDKLNADVLKVSHHGSKTSTTSDILFHISPKLALIGVGNNNKFGHPNEQILKRLQNSNIRIYRTDINGEINILVDKCGKIKIKTMY